MPAIAKLPHLKIYSGTNFPDSHIDTYKWNMQSLKLDKRFWYTHFLSTRAWFKSLAPNNISVFPN